MSTAEETARAIYSAANVPYSETPSGGAVELAVRIFGRGVVYRQPRALHYGAIAVFGGRRRIVVPGFATPEQTNFIVASKLVELVGADGVSIPDARAAAALVVAPEPAFRNVMRDSGLALPLLAQSRRAPRRTQDRCPGDHAANRRMPR